MTTPRFNDEYVYPLTVWADWELVRLIDARGPRSALAEVILRERRESRRTIRRVIRPIEQRLASHYATEKGGYCVR